MCGIAGLLRADERVDLGRLHHMARLLRHRGPDDEGMVLIDPASGAALALGGADTPAAVYASPHRYAPGAGARGGPQTSEPGGAFRRSPKKDLFGGTFSTPVPSNCRKQTR